MEPFTIRIIFTVSFGAFPVVYTVLRLASHWIFDGVYISSYLTGHFGGGWKREKAASCTPLTHFFHPGADVWYCLLNVSVFLIEYIFDRHSIV